MITAALSSGGIAQAQAKAAMATTMQAFVGTIKSFDSQKGWGHIDCEQTHQLYGKDMFLLRSQCGDIVPTRGDLVHFDVIEGQKGVEATNVRIEVAAQTSGPGVFFGTVKSWNPEKGWGHISCEQTHYLYEKDIFVMRSGLPGGHCLAGDEVSFSVRDGDKGPEATNVTIVSSARAPLLHNQAQNFIGTVKNFDEEKGWGHICCDATRQLYNKDMFVMRSALAGQTIAEGNSVQFSVDMGTKGPEAHNVVIVGRSGLGQVVPPPASFAQLGQWPAAGAFVPKVATVPRPGAQQQHAMHGRRFSGSIKNWNPEKGWGFITCQDTMNQFGKDIFLHQKEVAGQVILAGSAVQFSVSYGEDGRPIAINVAVNGGGYQPMQKGAASKGYQPY